MIKRSIIFLGTAASAPQTNKFTQSLVVCGLKECILLDAGEGVQMRLLNAGIDHRLIKLLAITHLHGDHIHGLLPFIETLGMKLTTQKDSKKFGLKIIAPIDLCKYVDLALNILKKEVLREFKIECIEARSVHRDNNPVISPEGEIVVLPIPVQHGVDEAYGYYVGLNIKDRTIGIFYSGDGICDAFCMDRLRELKPLIVVHEATFLDYPIDYSKARESHHATLYDAATLAKNIDAPVLVLTHISARYDEEDLRDFVSRARRIFQGDIFIARDLAKISLNVLYKIDRDMV